MNNPMEKIAAGWQDEIKKLQNFEAKAPSPRQLNSYGGPDVPSDPKNRFMYIRENRRASDVGNLVNSEYKVRTNTDPIDPEYINHLRKTRSPSAIKRKAERAVQEYNRGIGNTPETAMDYAVSWDKYLKNRAQDRRQRADAAWQEGSTKLPIATGTNARTAPRGIVSVPRANSYSAPRPEAAAAYTPNWTSPGRAYGPAMAKYTPPAATKTPFWTKNKAIGAGVIGAGAAGTAALVAALMNRKKKPQQENV